NPREKLNGDAGDATGQAAGHRKSQLPKPVLDAQASSIIRESLCGEVAALESEVGAIKWARRSIVAKNALTAEDAAAVERAFRDRLQVLQPEVYSLTCPASAGPTSLAGPQDGNAGISDLSQPLDMPGIGARPNRAAALRIRVGDGGAIPKPRRNRDKDHLG